MLCPWPTESDLPENAVNLKDYVPPQRTNRSPGDQFRAQIQPLGSYNWPCQRQFQLELGIILGLKPGLHVRRKHKHKKLTCKPMRRKHKRLVLAFVLSYACVVPVYTYDTSISTSTREWNDFHSLVLVLPSLRRTCKPARRKQRKLKNSDKLSAYILVRHVGIKSRAKRRARPRYRAKVLCFCPCVCHLMLMLIARVNILVLMRMLASYV